MRADFRERIFEKHSHVHKYPPTSVVCKLITKVVLLLFPEQTRKQFNQLSDFTAAFDQLETDLEKLLDQFTEELPRSSNELVSDFFREKLPEVYDMLLMDVDAILKGDPAAKTEYEVIRAYPGFYAIAFYRLAHALYQLGIPLLPRVITEYAHSRTGIDIHPGAEIEPYFFIDHGTGVVIGETTKIGRNVKIYQGVTLGALSVSKEMAETKRHPTIEDNVVIYSGATILGGDTVVGNDSIIGGNVWLTKSVPPYSTVYHRPQIEVKEVVKA